MISVKGIDILESLLVSVGDHDWMVDPETKSKYTKHDINPEDRETPPTNNIPRTIQRKAPQVHQNGN